MTTADTNCTMTNQTKGKPPRLPFVSIKNAILGEDYELGISFLSPRKQKEINLKYRNKDKTTNILSWSITKSSGDITFDLKKVKEDAKDFNMTYKEFLKYLFIHGCLHLKGFKHSSTMEKEEKKFLKKFK